MYLYDALDTKYVNKKIIIMEIAVNSPTYHRVNTKMGR